MYHLFILIGSETLRDIPKMMGLLMFGWMFILLIYHYGSNQYNQDSTIKTMQETIRATAISNRDDSARISRGVFILNKEKFEQDFVEKYELQKNIKSDPLQFKFDYLDNPLGGVKAIKVKVTNNQIDYQATSILDVAE